MDKQKQAARNQKEDVVLNRTLIWFGGAVVVELLLLLLNRYYINYNVSGITLMSNIHKALPVMIAALAVLTVVCAVWLYTGLKKKRSGLIPGLLTGVFGALALGCLAAFRFKGAGIQLMCTLVPAVAVLALVYYLYQREFFAITVLSALGLVGLWLFRKAGGGHAVVVYGYFAVVAVILVAAVLLARRLQQAEGMLKRGEKRIRVLGHGANYALFYVSCAVVAAALAAALILGAAAAYYLMFALVAWIFVLAVYFTVKPM